MSPDKSLAEILAHRMSAGEPIPVPVTLSILRQVCDVLEHAHNLCDPSGRPLGLVHGDVSPPHIFIGEAGNATLVSRMTPYGTPGYLAPEYLATGMMDARADLWALGVVAHEMLTNRPLFAAADERVTLDRVRSLEIPAPSSVNPFVPAELDGIVLMALSRDPAYRWLRAAMMREGLQTLARRAGLELPPGSPAWADLLAGRIERRPELPVTPQPGSAPPPWVDDNDDATRIEPMDPGMFVAIAQIPTPPPAPAPAPPAPAPLVEAAPPPPVAPPPPARQRRLASEVNDVGPEPTQIGARPLISFADDPASNVPISTPIGAPLAHLAPRTSRPSLPPPVAMYVPDPEEPRRKRMKLIAAAALLAVIAIVVIVLAVR